MHKSENPVNTPFAGIFEMKKGRFYDKFTTNEGIFMRDYADLCQYLNGEDIEINGKIVKTPQNPPCIIVNYVLFLVRNKKVFFRAG